MLKGQDHQIAKIIGFSNSQIAEKQTKSKKAAGNKNEMKMFRYKSPEQLKEAEEDEKIDVWGFGCLLL